MSRIGHHIAGLSEVGTLRKPIIAAAVTAFITGSVIAAELAPIEAAGIVNAPPAEAGKVWTTGPDLRPWLAPHAGFDLRLGGLMRTNPIPTGTRGDEGTIVNRVPA